MISFIICTYNRANILKKCIDSVVDSCSKHLDDIEILVIDNNSSDNTSVLVEELATRNEYIKYYKELNVGLSFARNRGIKEANGSYVVFLDDDVILDKDYLINLLQFINNNNDVVCIAGKIIPIWKQEKPKWFSDEFFSIIGETRYGSEVRILEEREYPMGGNMIFLKSTFNEIGYFNTDLGIKGDKLFLGEEVDICERVRKRGYDLYYSPDLVCHHRVHENKVNKEYILNRLRLEGKSVAKWHMDTLNKFGLIKSLVRRYCILTIRDIPLYMISSKFRLDSAFAKKCKYLRSKEYISEIKNYLYNR